MNKLNLWEKVNTKTVCSPNWLILMVAVGLFPIFGWGMVVKSYASHEARPRTATFYKVKGNVRVYPNGSSPEKTPNQHPVLRSSATVKDKLLVVGDSKSWAHLQFWKKQPNKSRRIDPLVQAGVNKTLTEYTFACHAKVGTTVFAWGLTPVGFSACERIVLGMANWKTSKNGNYFAEKSAIKAADRDAQIADNLTPSLEEITISRSKQKTLIYAHNLNAKLSIDVLVGAVTINSLAGQITVEAGTRYIYSGDGTQGTTSSINPAEVSKSPSVETFLEPENWSKEVSSLIKEFRAILTTNALTTPTENPSLTSENKEALNAHNKWRKQVGVPPLRWSNQLAKYASDCAKKITAQGGKLEHCRTGENLFWASGRRWSPSEVVDRWGKEVKNYNYSTNSCSGGECKHYTQIVWRDSKEVGCGVSRSGREEVWVCNYNPPGNFIGRKPY